MPDVFISYAQEDTEIAEALAAGLEEQGYSTWRYEADVGAGDDYLLSTRHNIEACKAFLLLISPDGVDSDQIDKEVVRAHECRKPFVPVLYRIDYDEFSERQPKWQQAIGSATAVVVPKNGDVGAIMPRLISGMKRLAGESQAGRLPRRSTMAWSTRRRIKLAVRITRWVAIIAVLLAAAAGGGWLYLEKRISQAKQAAERARQEKNPVKAVENLGWVLTWRPGDAEARILRARLYLQMSQPLDARSDADALLAADPDNGEAHFLRARSFQNEGKFAEAVPEFDLAIKNGWKKPESYESRGRTLAALDRDKDAEADFTTVIENGGAISDTYFDRGLARIALEKYDAAEADLDKAIDDDPKWGDALGKRAAVRMKRLRDFLVSDKFRNALASPDSQNVIAFVRNKLEGIQDDLKRALASSSLDPGLRELTDQMLDGVSGLVHGFQTGRYDARYFEDMAAKLSGNPGGSPSSVDHDRRPPAPPVPAGAPTAYLRNVRVQYDAVVRGVYGIVFYVDVSIANAAGHNCRVAVLIKYSNNNPVMSRSPDWRNNRGELMTSADIKPDRDNYNFAEFGIFLPYDQLPRQQRFFNYSMAVIDGPNAISPDLKGQFDGSLVGNSAPQTVITDPTRRRNDSRFSERSTVAPPFAQETTQSLRAKIISDSTRNQWRACLDDLNRLTRVDASNRAAVAETADTVLKPFYEQFPPDTFTPTAARESKAGVAKLRELLLPVAEVGSAYAALLVAESFVSYDEDGRIDAIDAAQALRFAEQAANGNLARGCLYAGQIYGRMGADAAPEKRAEFAQKSVDFLKRGARLGSPESTALLALRFYDYQYNRNDHSFNPDPQLSDERQKKRGYDLAASVRDRTPRCMWIYALYCYKEKDYKDGNEYVIRAARAGDPSARQFCRAKNVAY